MRRIKKTIDTVGFMYLAVYLSKMFSSFFLFWKVGMSLIFGQRFLNFYGVYMFVMNEKIISFSLSYICAYMHTHT